MFITKIRNIKNINELNDAAKALNSKIKVVMKFNDQDLRFTLTEALTSEEDAALDNLVTTFDDQDPELQVPKIYSLAKAEASTKHFHNINYKSVDLTQALIPLRTVTRGEVTKVEWFKTLDAEMKPTDLVLKVDIAYNRDTTGFATSRVTTRTWINEDGTENPEVKVTNKFYFVNPSDMIDEGLRRRKLLVNTIQIPTLTFMTEVLTPLGYNQEAIVLKGRAFMDDYEQDFSNFVENSSTITDISSPDAGMKTIVVKLRDENNLSYNEWLDKAPASLGGMITIRQYLINEFSI